jgi:hypothetical protein
MGLNKVLIDKYASKGRSQVISEFKEEYLSKKGDRFFEDGITYEIGQISQEKGEMEIEISSKIPVDEISEANKEKFFSLVKERLEKQDTPPFYIAMDDIVKKVGEREVKKRDYIRLKYRIKTDDFHDDKSIVEKAEKIARQQSTEKIPPIPEVSSIPGKLVLAAVQEGFYHFIKNKVNKMLEANQEVKKKYVAPGANT